jgi:hypothetical protein
MISNYRRGAMRLFLSIAIVYLPDRMRALRDDATAY